MKPARWPIALGIVVGAALMSVGVSELFATTRDTHPASTARWVIGLALAHDLLVAPVVLAIGAILRRWSPAWARGPLAGGLVVSAVIVAATWPAWRGYGRLPGNPSVLPRDYDRGLVLVLGVVWVITALLVVRRRLGERPTTPPLSESEA